MLQDGEEYDIGFDDRLTDQKRDNGSLKARPVNESEWTNNMSSRQQSNMQSMRQTEKEDHEE